MELVLLVRERDRWGRLPDFLALGVQGTPDRELGCGRVEHSEPPAETRRPTAQAGLDAALGEKVVGLGGEVGGADAHRNAPGDLVAELQRRVHFARIQR